MASEIIYVCNSVNNKNIREGELQILEKHEDELYFEFGKDDTNIKKRFYNDKETLNKDFNALLKLKAHELVEESKEEDLIKPVEEAFEEVADEEFRNVPVFEEPKKAAKKGKRKNSLF